MTKVDRELNDTAAKVVKLMDRYPLSERAALFVNIISNVFLAGKESGRQEALQDRAKRGAAV